MTKKQQTQPAKKSPTYSDADIIAALERQAGIISLAAKSLGCDRTTIWRRMQASPEVRAACEAITERNIDRAEAKLVEAINAGNLTAVIFFLKTKGRHRGYNEKVDIEARTVVSGALELITPDDVKSADNPDAALRLFERTRKQLEDLPPAGNA